MNINLHKTKIYLEKVTPHNHKYYQMVLDNNRVIVSYGRIGRPGKSKTFTFPSLKEALVFFDNQVTSKSRRGYSKAIKGLTPPRIRGIHPNQLRIAFEIIF